MFHKEVMYGEPKAHLKSINPFPKFLARGRTNISDHHLYEMKNLACGGEEKDETITSPF